MTLRGLAADHAKFRKLAKVLGVSPSVLEVAGIAADTKPQDAVDTLKRLAGPKAWRQAAASSGLRASTVLIRAMRGQPARPRVADDKPRDKPRKRDDEDDSEHTAEDEPDPDEGELCQRETCEHSWEEHRDGGRCQVDGCPCRSFVSPDSGKDGDEKEPPPSPEERARAERIVARSDSTLTVEQVIAAERAQFGRPTKRRRPSKRASSRRTVVDRLVARGMDRARAEATYDQQFPKGKR